MPRFTHRFLALTVLAGSLAGCTGVVPSNYQGKWSCSDITLGSRSVRIDIDGNSVSWAQMSMMPAWKAEVEKISPDGSGHFLHLKGGPYGMVKVETGGRGLVIERYQCAKAL